jgi:hypothetical protein
MRHLKFLLPIFAAFFLLTGCASAGKGNKLQEAQYAWSAAIRWGDFEGAWNLVDPEYRKAHPMAQADFDRYKQVQIAGYRDLAARADESTAMREIQISVIDGSNMSQYDIRYTERWRYDSKENAWWILDGLPQVVKAP